MELIFCYYEAKKTYFRNYKDIWHIFKKIKPLQIGRMPFKSNFTVHGYRNLIVWEKSMQLVCAIYECTKLLPNEERYVLTFQMRKAAVSISSNIAEGRRRKTRADYAHFLQIAYASGAELETQIEICKRLQYFKSLSSAKADQLLDEVIRMLNAYIARIHASAE